MSSNLFVNVGSSPFAASRPSTSWITMTFSMAVTSRFQLSMLTTSSSSSHKKKALGLLSFENETSPWKWLRQGAIQPVRKCWLSSVCCIKTVHISGDCVISHVGDSTLHDEWHTFEVTTVIWGGYLLKVSKLYKAIMSQLNYPTLSDPPYIWFCKIRLGARMHHVVSGANHSHLFNWTFSIVSPWEHLSALHRWHDLQLLQFHCHRVRSKNQNTRILWKTIDELLKVHKMIWSFLKVPPL